MAARPTLVLAVLLFAGASFAMSQTVVVTALPNIAAHFETSTTATSWILTAFLLSGSIATPIVGKLGDLYGKRHVLTAIMLVFAAGAVIAALSGSIGLLIGGRVLQGTAGGVFPLAFGVIRDSFPEQRVAGSLGIMSAVFGIGAGLGLPLSGLIVDHLGVPWLFWIGLTALPAALATFLLIPSSPSSPVSRIDWLGAALLSASIAGVLLGISQGNDWGWVSTPTVAAIGGGLALAAVFLAHEMRTPAPLLELAILRHPAVALANLTAFLVGTAMFVSFVLNPQLAQTPGSVGYGFGTSATVAGLLLLSTALSQLVAGPLAGRVGARIGFRPVLAVGTLLTAAAGAWLLALHSHEWDLVISGAILGAGIGSAFAAIANLVVAAVPRSRVGVATGLNTVMRTVGGAFGSAIATACLAGHTVPGTSAPDEGAFVAGFAIASAIGLAAFAAALRMPRRISPAPA